MARKLKKKGQEVPVGSSAAVVIGAITVLIIFYIVFLPPAERAVLLGTESLSGDGTTGTSFTIYEKAIGKVDYSGARYYDHTIPNLFLSETTDTKSLKEFSAFLTQNGWFVKNQKELEFSLTNLQNTDFVRLSFDAEKHEGILRVTLNNKIIYENEITTFTVAPIELERNLLRADNKLKFEVSGVGLRFWKKNEYSFTNVKILADITDRTKQEGQNLVIIRKEEKDNIESSYLQFDAICQQSAVGPLEVYFNNREVYNAVPDCNTLNRIDVNPEDISEGMNTLRFRTTEGNYRLETMKLRVYQKEGRAIVDYFTIEEEDWEDIKNAETFIRIRFVDDGEDKTAQLNINGRFKYIDQKEPEYEVKITRFLEQGNNYIRIEPKTSFEIVDVKIYTE